MKAHWLDKLILRDLFWFIVLPYQFGQWAASQQPADQAHGGE